jgi:putative hydrolase of HD superfamily
LGEKKIVKGGIAKYLYELGQLKRVRRSGWWIAGVKDPESVAEHSFRTAVIAYILAQLEGADPSKVTLMALFHDMSEARTNDLHRIARRYVDWENVEEKVVKDQSKRLPNEIAKQITSLLLDFEKASSLEARVVRDADLLECLIQAREYQALGYRDVADWISNSQAALTTDSAKRIASECLETETKEWWQGLKA